MGYSGETEVKLWSWLYEGAIGVLKVLLPLSFVDTAVELWKRCRSLLSK